MLHSYLHEDHNPGKIGENEGEEEKLEKKNPG
jgi:hypothetical protein